MLHNINENLLPAYLDTTGSSRGQVSYQLLNAFELGAPDLKSPIERTDRMYSFLQATARIFNAMTQVINHLSAMRIINHHVPRVPVYGNDTGWWARVPAFGGEHPDIQRARTSVHDYLATGGTTPLRAPVWGPPTLREMAHATRRPAGFVSTPVTPQMMPPGTQAIPTTRAVGIAAANAPDLSYMHAMAGGSATALRQWAHEAPGDCEPRMSPAETAAFQVAALSPMPIPPTQLDRAIDQTAQAATQTLRGIAYAGGAAVGGAMGAPLGPGGMALGVAGGISGVRLAEGAVAPAVDTAFRHVVNPAVAAIAGAAERANPDQNGLYAQRVTQAANIALIGLAARSGMRAAAAVPTAAIRTPLAPPPAPRMAVPCAPGPRMAAPVPAIPGTAFKSDIFTPRTPCAIPGTDKTYDVYQRRDINWDQVRTAGPLHLRGKTNAEASRLGRPPQLPDGYFATLHHIGQHSKGPLAEASTRLHHWSNPQGFRALHNQFGPGKGHPTHPVDHSNGWKAETKAY